MTTQKLTLQGEPGRSKCKRYLPLWHPSGLEFDDVVMDQVERKGRRVRRWRSVTEKRQVVELTMRPGASVSSVARDHGLEREPVVQV